MGLDITQVSRQLGITTTFKDTSQGKVKYLPQKIAVVGQGNTAATFATTPLEITSAGQAAIAFGYGSPLHLACRELFPVYGGGVGSIPVVAFPLDDAATGVAAAGAIGATGTQATAQSYKIRIGGIVTSDIPIPAGTTADAALALIKTAIDSVLEMPVTTGTIAASSLPLTAKWKGKTGNDILIEIIGTVSGITFSLTQPTGGDVNPDIDDALDLIGTDWFTLVLNCFNYDDTDTLDKVFAFGDGRWSNTVYAPLVSIYGTSDVYATRSVITDARKLDNVNCVIPAVGCPNMPHVIAGAAVREIAKQANKNPAVGYKAALKTLIAGSSASQENSAALNLSVNKGSSTTILKNGYITLNDIVTMYHPDAEMPNPGYRCVVTIIKLMNVIYNVKKIFESDEWIAAPLIPDADNTLNPAAKKPKDAKTVLGNLADSLGNSAIISDVAYTQENLSASISSQNPNRLDTVFPVKISGNIEVNSVDLTFGFYYGGE